MEVINNRAKMEQSSQVAKVPINRVIQIAKQWYLHLNNCGWWNKLNSGAGGIDGPSVHWLADETIRRRLIDDVDKAAAKQAVDEIGCELKGKNWNEGAVGNLAVYVLAGYNHIDRQETRT